MKNRLAHAFTVVDHQPVITNALLFAYLRGNPEQAPHEVLIGGFQVGHGGYMAPGYNEDMGGRLGIEILKGDIAVVLVNLVTVYFTGSNFTENTIGHGTSFFGKREKPLLKQEEAWFINIPAGGKTKENHNSLPRVFCILYTIKPGVPSTLRSQKEVEVFGRPRYHKKDLKPVKNQVRFGPIKMETVKSAEN